MAYGHQMCAKCKTQRPIRTVENGICSVCRGQEQSELQKEAAIQAKVEAWLPILGRDLYVLSRFAWFLRERNGDEPADPCWRHRDLPYWRRDRAVPMTYDD